jgi:hypothetical protein
MTKSEFATKVMAPLWVHSWKPPDDAVAKKMIDDYYKAFGHYADDRLITAVDKMICQHDGRGGIPKIVKFFGFIPSIAEDHLLPYENANSGGPIPGIARYIGMIHHADGTYPEQVAAVLEIAKQENAHERTIAVLEGALKGE